MSYSMRQTAIIDKMVLRSETPDDDVFLSNLYATTRDDIHSLLWSDEQKAGLCHSQFLAQRKYYREFFEDATFDVILLAGHPIGRLYVRTSKDEIRVVDISLMPEMRGKGIGTTLMQRVLIDGECTRLPVRLRVRHDTPARQWYEQMGFSCIADEEFHWHMERLPSEDKNE